MEKRRQRDRKRNDEIGQKRTVKVNYIKEGRGRERSLDALRQKNAKKRCEDNRGEFAEASKKRRGFEGTMQREDGEKGQNIMGHFGFEESNFCWTRDFSLL